MTMITTTLAAAIVAAAGVQAPATPLGGQWEGALAVGGRSIKVVLRVDATGDTVRAVMDSPDQGANGLPVEGLALEAGVVRFTVPSVGGRFEGALSPDGRTLTGTMTQGPAAMPLVLTRTADAASIAGPRRPQQPVPPYPYRSEEVAYDAGPGVHLAGTLTLPQGEGPFPAVLLITGSGAQDRDETVFGHKPFLVLADALTRRGLAVLRVDDRGVGGSTGPMAEATTADFANDARAGVAWLAGRSDIAPNGIGLIGHSEGGVIAPLVAGSDPRVAWVVLIAGPAVSGADVLTEQSRRFQQASGIAPVIVEANAGVQARVMAAIAQHADDGEAASEAVTALLTGTGVPQAMIAQASGQAKSPWLRWFAAHDPAPSLTALRVPILAVYGGKDLQVPADQSSEVLRRIAPSAEVVVLPGLNHLMQTATTGLSSEYGTIEETIAPAALDLIVDWAAARAGLPAD